MSYTPLGLFALRDALFFCYGARFRCASLGQEAHEIWILQQRLETILGRHLAVHVALEVGKLLASLQKLGKHRNLARHCRRAEIVYFFEFQLDADLRPRLALAAELVLHPESH